MHSDSSLHDGVAAGEAEQRVIDNSVGTEQSPTPRHIVAGDHLLEALHSVFNINIYCAYIVAARRVGLSLRQDGVGGDDKAVPHIALASGEGGSVCCRVVYREMYGHDAVAFCRIGQRLLDAVAGVVGGAAPNDAVAFRQRAFGRRGVLYGQNQRDDAVASGGIGGRMLRRSAGEIGDAVYP